MMFSIDAPRATCTGGFKPIASVNCMCVDGRRTDGRSDGRTNGQTVDGDGVCAYICAQTDAKVTDETDGVALVGLQFTFTRCVRVPLMGCGDGSEGARVVGRGEGVDVNKTRARGTLADKTNARAHTRQ